MRNKDFLKQYVDGEYIESAHGMMTYRDGRLFSYDTVICDINRVLKEADVNIRKYSATTSRMQNTLLALLHDAGYEVRTYEGDYAYIYDVGAFKRR